jgi:glyoxalase family protein
MGYWVERLQHFKLDLNGPFTRFAEEVLVFHDPDGLELELVGSAVDPRPGANQWPVPPQYAIRGFWGVTLSIEGYERTAELLTTPLGFQAVQNAANRFRYQVGSGGPGTFVDLLCQPNRIPGQMGVGVVHHVAWRTPDDETQRRLRQDLADREYNVTPVIDRQYFHSVYFREPGQILFEIATDPPGFTIDENATDLGEHLKLPPWLEPYRDELEHRLPELHLPKLASLPKSAGGRA